ncbi:sigma-70 family RNA polymerase sigma factor [Corticibacter populi]|uniref:Sigma-70 family RNA polymerase sigma factor n=1 Tax=Corticibacter populi TaxID=1550736 RepID=A0A3M6QZF0_9BURK|nr:sigma-70 family RNA polymerase sigma factor [Corticibacter populi]RMX08293.1 sigma-70 family RNA polymerase sigma factor [Corticibacter populi]RZS35575.1 RNA polymerase sigma-70 factor (ECF subfamily) [Corticibacter populi]
MSSPASLTPALLAHYEELVTYVHKRFPAHDFARDVIHQVCLQLLHSPPDEEVRAPLAYLRRMSLHRALDWCRARTRSQAWLDYVEAPPDSRSHDEDGACLLDFQQQLQALVDIIEALPPRPRQCFLLHRIHGMEQADIANQTGISRAAVAQHVRTATQRICRDWAPARHLASGRLDAGAARANAGST